ncbi:endo-1,4-beta-xylanase-4 [Coleophoma cylindrospora]|uniref:Endo-1,5-alpha-L-arabinanase A n=1 Tax=Coleophoma cylindrospora TaxID=1849047 RepID=A0A3D8RHA0_9HELO|nr:endo-1,4-beta-xylanase-4 [Coleophoma cylindrospora]
MRLYWIVAPALALAAINEHQNLTRNTTAALDAVTITNLNDVRSNLFLPLQSEGLNITWQSSNASIISTDGIVQRPSFDGQVTLTASINYEGVLQQREFVALVRKAVELAPFEGYAFAYFKGDSVAGENIFFAASVGNNALQWQALNGDQPILTSTLGTRGLRDPFIIRSPEGDTFYVIATDLSIGSGTSWADSVRIGSRYLEVWESHDLITWSAQRQVLVSPPTAGNTWAPEAYFDDSIGSYVVFWASSLYAEADLNHTGSTYNRMLYSTTRDFVTFSDPVIWQDAGMSRIDSTVIKVDGVYYRFSKDEGYNGTGCSDIIEERSSNLRATLPSWTEVDACIGKKAGTGAVEGPTSFKSNPGDVNGDKYYLFLDEYTGRGYIPLETADISRPNWVVSNSSSLPKTPRHGTVMPITASELTSLTTSSLSSIKARQVSTDAEILRYDFTLSKSGQLLDLSGNGRDATINGNVTVEGGVMTFDGVTDFVQLPDNLLAGVANLTVEIEVLIDDSQTSPYFIFGIGNTLSGSGNGYVYLTGDTTYHAGIASGDWQTEQTATSGSELPRGSWLNLTYTIGGSTSILYLNGAEVARNSNLSIKPSDIGNGSTTSNYIGHSTYSTDNLLKGQVKSFAIYGRELSASEVLSNSGNFTEIAAVSLTNSSVLKFPPVVDSDIQGVIFPVFPGTDTTSLSPIFSTAAGVTTTPESGTAVDLTSNVTYTLSQGNTAIAAWTMKAVQAKSPVLPGLYADPNIAVFNQTYYIYPTTDGVPNWGGNVLYVWKSLDLVNWSRSAQPLLTLDGVNGNVPWANGNAWAPTIAERDGKYYLYFSGNNPTYNIKTIGAAVASSPEGPFTAQPMAMILNNETVTAGQAIDPDAFVDPVSGKYYLIWGNGNPLAAELNDDMVSINWDTALEMQGLVDFREGMFLVYRQGLYHLTYSIDDTGSPNYRVGYATSEAPTGPWTYQGVILQKDVSQGILATGHNSMISVPGTDDWYIAYHRFAIPNGSGYQRETTIDKVTFDPTTGLIQVIKPTLTSVEPEPVPAANATKI